MTERRTQQFGPTEATASMQRPPLSERQSQIYDLAVSYRKSHKGKLMPQRLIAQTLDITPRTTNQYVRQIFEKGYAIPVFTRGYKPAITPENEERLRVLQKRNAIVKKVEELRVGQGLSAFQIWLKVKAEHPNITESYIETVLQWLRDRERIPRTGKRRTKQELEAIDRGIITRRPSGKKNKVIAKELSVSEKYVEGRNSHLFAQGRLERRPQGARPSATRGL